MFGIEQKADTLRKLYLHLTATMLVIYALVMFSGCEGLKSDIPAYLKIDTFILDSTGYDSTGSLSHNIEYAWVYVNQDFQGTYLLPMNAPILAEGKVKLEIFAGVRESGFVGSAIRYPYYKRFSDSVNFVRGDTSFITPHVRYQEGLKIPFKEDFESNLSPKFSKTSGSGSFSYQFQPGQAFEGNGYGSLFLPDGSTEDLLVETNQYLIAPKGIIDGYFVEMDYRSVGDFIVGIKTPDGYTEVIGLKARETWNKIYINITGQYDMEQSDNLKIFFRALRDTTISNQQVFLDNVKVVYKN